MFFESIFVHLYNANKKYRFRQEEFQVIQLAQHLKQNITNCIEFNITEKNQVAFDVFFIQAIKLTISE
jgi:hypothetical protein